MELFKKIKQLIRKDKVEKVNESGFPSFPDDASQQEIQDLDTRVILKDRIGEDLICEVCGNQDNETNEYYPIREGEKKVYSGKVFHIKCFRAFQKQAKKGNLI